MNKRYRQKDWIDSRIEIRSSPLHGKGMFAVAPIKKGEVVVIWGLHPTYSSKEEAERASADGRAKGRLTIVHQLDENLFVVDDREKPVPSDFINHSCDPNIWFEDEATLTTRRDIKLGEELTLDYACGIDCEDFVAPWECFCGSPLCRKRITGKDWRIPELQERYAGHFTPLVSKWIAGLKGQKARACKSVKIISHCSRPINPIDVKKIYSALNWWPERTIEEIEEVLDCNCYAAWHENRVVGFVRYLTDGNFRAYIEDFMVLPDYQGEGVGQLLMKKSLEDFQEIDIISLFCDEGLMPFYEKCGFELSKKKRVMLSPPAHFLRSRARKK